MVLDRQKWQKMIPVTIVMGIIFFLSHQPGDALDLPEYDHLDKVLHVGIYTILGLTAGYVVPGRLWSAHRLLTAAGVILLCFLYGIIDEYHQSFIPGRYPSWQDALADLVGGVIAVVVYISFLHWQHNKSK